MDFEKKNNKHFLNFIVKNHFPSRIYILDAD